VNGEGMTYWLSAPNQLPATLTAELNGEYYVSMVAVDWHGGCGAKNWQLHIQPPGEESGDGSKKLVTAREDEPNHAHQEVVLPLNLRARQTGRVSITVTEPWADVVGVTNITVYALPVASLEEDGEGPESSGKPSSGSSVQQQGLRPKSEESKLDVSGMDLDLQKVFFQARAPRGENKGNKVGIEARLKAQQVSQGHSSRAAPPPAAPPSRRHKKSYEYTHNDLVNDVGELLQQAADTVLTSEPPLRPEWTRPKGVSGAMRLEPPGGSLAPAGLKFAFIDGGSLGIHIERQRGWDRSRVTRVEGMALRVGVAVGDVLTHANGQGLAKLAPSEIAKLLLPRPLTLRIQRYAPPQPAGTQLLKGGGAESADVLGGLMEEEACHGELINLLQGRYKEAMERIAALEEQLAKKPRGAKAANPSQDAATEAEEDEREELPESKEDLHGEVRLLRRLNRQLEGDLETERGSAVEARERHGDRLYLLQTELDRLREENEAHLLLARTASTPDRVGP